MFNRVTRSRRRVIGLASLGSAAVRQRRRRFHPLTRPSAHALNRLTFGPRPGDLDSCQDARDSSRGSNVSSTRRRIDDSEMTERLSRLTTLGLDSQTLAREVHQPARRERQRCGAHRVDFGRGKPLDTARDEPLDLARDKPFDFAQGRPKREERHHSTRSADHHRPERGQGAARHLQRTPARRSARRFLVQPLQRLRRQGTDARLDRRVRARGDSAATSSAISGRCSRRSRRVRRCCSISTTG